MVLVGRGPDPAEEQRGFEPRAQVMARLPWLTERRIRMPTPHSTCCSSTVRAARRSPPSARMRGPASARRRLVPVRRAWAPSLRSRDCSLAVVVPDVTVDADAYVDAVLEVVKASSPRLLVPGYDGSIEALRAQGARRSSSTWRWAWAATTPSTLRCSKPRTIALAQDLGIAVPRGGSVGVLPAQPRSARVGSHHS